ncbi:hypothetical protein ILT44_25460 [Microvirga sp. BT689]|uniref:hypothetical protein n=1 Tax=Microvirga arvi TaxID=2778731 RepID=UPI00194E7128|nr:hypothetical protein [Microvirga arvi]MBM6583552.1 hypothetical protein [Microvirga arvi]
MRNSDKPLAVQEAQRQGFGVIRLYTNVPMTENIALYLSAELRNCPPDETKT